jgi:tRNA A-37 threonylcarbamoyl transferase component Bud32
MMSIMHHDLMNSPAKASFESEVRERVTSLHKVGFVHGNI